MKKEGLGMIALAVVVATVPLLLVEGRIHNVVSGIGIFFGICSFAFGLVMFFDKPLQGKQYE